MPEPRVVNPGLAACSDRPAAGAAVAAPSSSPQAAHSGESARSARSAHIDPIDPIDPSDPGDPGALADRERWLFRHVTRAGQVHPLRHLLKRYRAGERA
jgi:hypothetical protein